MLTKKDLHPAIGMMTGSEIETYWVELHQWINNNLQYLTDTSKWTTEDEKKFDEGLRLISSLRSAKDFVLGAHKMLPAKRMKTMQSFVNEVEKYIRRNANELHVVFCEHDGVVDLQSIDTRSKLNSPERREIRKFVAKVSTKQVKRADSTNTGKPAKEEKCTEVAGRRPQHLSQYIHLLPEHLQKESQNLEDWYLLLSEKHHLLHTLANDKRASDADRRVCAEAVALTEQKILNFWARVDVAYEERQGKRVSSTLKKSLIHEARNLATSGKVKGDMEYSREEIEAMEDGEEKERIRAARIQRDKHYIQRCDAKSKPGSRAKVRVAIQELHDWNIMLSPKMKENALSYGFDDIPKEWYAVTPAEKAEAKRLQEEEKQRQLEEQRLQAELALKAEEERKEREKIEKENQRVAERDTRRKRIKDLFNGTFVNN